MNAESGYFKFFKPMVVSSEFSSDGKLGEAISKMGRMKPEKFVLCASSSFGKSQPIFIGAK